MENDSAKMARLLGALRVEMNGAVTDSMRAHGIAYPLNYGVSVPTIRALASQFAPDHSLAKLLYSQQVRELKLSALTIADPHAVTPDELEFWANGIENIEVAEHLAATIFGSGDLPQETLKILIVRFLSPTRARFSSSPQLPSLMKYTALLCASRQAERVWRTGIFENSNLPSLILPALNSLEIYVWRAVAAFLSRSAISRPETIETMQNLLDFTETNSIPSAKYLREELDWQIH